MKNLQEDIKTGNFKNVYLLFGEEAYLKIQYKEKLIHALNPDDDTMNFSKYEGKGIEVREMIDLCETMPFFADRRVVLVENSGFLWRKKSTNETGCIKQSKAVAELWNLQSRMRKL